MPPGASHNLLLGDETASRLRGERRLDSRDYPTLGDADDTNPNGGAGDDTIILGGHDGGTTGRSHDSRLVENALDQNALVDKL